MAQKANALGDYLRARRQQVRPEDVGFDRWPAPGGQQLLIDHAQPGSRSDKAFEELRSLAAE
jgi:hypothetical protein